VHCILYGGKDGVVYAVHGEQQPHTVRSIATVIMMGGNAYFDIVWEDGTESPQVPEAIIRSVQWRILPGIADDGEIKAMREHTTQEKERREKAAQEAIVQFVATAEGLRGHPEYAHLDQGDDQSSGKLAAKNIRAELKRVFPQVSFSVRKKHYGSVSVSWFDGPTTKEVEAVTGKYESGSFNGSDDTYENAISPWNTVFGGSKYISCNRSYSFDFLKAAVSTVAARCEIGSVTVERQDSGESYLAHARQDDQRVIYDYLEKQGRFVEEPESAREGD
jgi:hypothetical protein